MRVALTGPDGDLGSLGEGLRAYGVETVGLPLLEFVPEEERLRDWVRSGLRRYDYVAFTSPRAVDVVARLLDALPGIPSVCFAVGAETAGRARKAGFEVVVEGPGTGAAGLLDAVHLSSYDHPVAGRSILVPASDRARTELAEGLRALDAVVDVVVAYSVRPVEDPARRVHDLAGRLPDAAVLASPSAAAVLAEGAAGGGTALPPLFAIGRTTAEAMLKVGLPVAGAAAKPTPLGILTALKEAGMTNESSGRFPASRPRRLRRTRALRRMVRETTLTPGCLVAPMFVVPGRGVRHAVPAMPGVFRVSPDEAAKDARELRSLGVPAAILFGIPERKDAEGSSAWDPKGPVCAALRLMKEEVADLVLWADVCLCEYTSHGHCGVLDERGAVKNDEALPLLARAAVAYAAAGADAVAPSDMMDGRVGAIRTALDREGWTDTLLVSYAVKYASAFYGPFRDAAGSTPRSGDRKSYQMDPANVREALREAALDEAEGADVLMVKPALPYLDVVRAVRERTTLPVAAYNVSGEYAMLKAAAERGWIDGDRAILEALTSIRRAGADLIVTYHAAEAARLLG